MILNRYPSSSISILTINNKVLSITKLQQWRKTLQARRLPEELIEIVEYSVFSQSDQVEKENELRKYALNKSWDIIGHPTVNHMTFTISGLPSFEFEIDKFPGFVLMLSEGGHRFTKGYIDLVSGLIDNIYFGRLINLEDADILNNEPSLEDKLIIENMINEELKQADVLKHSLQFMLDDYRIWSLLTNEIEEVLSFENVIDRSSLSFAIFYLKKDNKPMHLEELSDSVLIKAAPNGELEYQVDPSYHYSNEEEINHTLSVLHSIEQLILTDMEYLKIKEI